MHFVVLLMAALLSDVVRPEHINPIGFMYNFRIHMCYVYSRAFNVQYIKGGLGLHPRNPRCAKGVHYHNSPPILSGHNRNSCWFIFQPLADCKRLLLAVLVGHSDWVDCTPQEAVMCSYFNWIDYFWPVKFKEIARKNECFSWEVPVKDQ